MDSMRFAVLVKDHSSGMPASSNAAAAQHSINTPALLSIAGQCAAAMAVAAEAPPTDAKGSAMALQSICLRIDGVWGPR